MDATPSFKVDYKKKKNTNVFFKLDTVNSGLVDAQ